MYGEYFPYAMLVRYKYIFPFNSPKAPTPSRKNTPKLIFDPAEKFCTACCGVNTFFFLLAGAWDTLYLLAPHKMRVRQRVVIGKGKCVWLKRSCGVFLHFESVFLLQQKHNIFQFSSSCDLCIFLQVHFSYFISLFSFRNGKIENSCFSTFIIASFMCFLFSALSRLNFFTLLIFFSYILILRKKNNNRECVLINQFFSALESTHKRKSNQTRIFRF